MAGFVRARVSDPARIRGAGDHIRPGEVIGPCQQAGGRSAGNVLSKVGVVIPLRQSVLPIVIGRIVLIVESGRPAAAGTDENEVPTIAGDCAYHLPHGAFESGPARGRNIALPRGHVDSQHPLLGLGRNDRDKQAGSYSGHGGCGA